MDDNKKKNERVDWSKYGLGNHDNPGNSQQNLPNYDGLDTDIYPTGANELYAQDFNANPWWKSNFFISQPVLFGTWDGVFTSCLINIFGVIILLRSGWIVGQAGALHAVLIILSTGKFYIYVYLKTFILIIFFFFGSLCCSSYGTVSSRNM